MFWKKCRKHIAIISLIMLCCLTFVSCGVDSSTDNATSDVTEEKSVDDVVTIDPESDTEEEEYEEITDYPGDNYENEFVLGVKYGTPNDYPDLTYGEAFDYFFGSPKWTAFEGVKEGETKAYDIVEFTGTCLYQDVEVEALIQFTISDDFETFEATYFSLNDVPMSNYELSSLIEKVFTDYSEAKQMESQKAVPSS